MDIQNTKNYKIIIINKLKMFLKCFYKILKSFTCKKMKIKKRLAYSGHVFPTAL